MRSNGASGGPTSSWGWDKVVVLASIVGAACTGACRKAPDAGDKSAAIDAGTASTTSAELGTAPTIELHDDIFTVVRNEQLALLARLEDAIDRLDRDLVAVKADRQLTEEARQARTRKLLQRRGILDADVQRINESDERGWDEVKAEIEHDLEGSQS